MKVITVVTILMSYFWVLKARKNYFGVRVDTSAFFFVSTATTFIRYCSRITRHELNSSTSSTFGLRTSWSFGYIFTLWRAVRIVTSSWRVFEVSLSRSKSTCLFT